jgi:hypothetical protein
VLLGTQLWTTVLGTQLWTTQVVIK